MTLHQFARSLLLSTAGAVLTCLASPPAGAQEPAPVVRVTAGPAEKAADAVVNLNSASVDELALLPGVGLRKAEAIVVRREKKRFNRPEEILEVRGFGRAMFKRCKPYLRVSGPTTLVEKVRATRTKG
jgi:competence protein ComEA